MYLVQYITFYVENITKMIKYQINGIITIPAGIAQEDELQIDSPIVEIVNGYQKGNGNTGQADVSVGLRYTYMQGKLKKTLEINRPYEWDDLNTDQQNAVVQLIQQSWALVLGIPDHTGATIIEEN